MALEPSPDPVQRAVDSAKAQDVPAEWPALSTSIRDRVRGLTAPAQPVLVRAADGSPVHDRSGSRTFVSSRVLLAAVRLALQSEPTHAPSGIAIEIEDDELVGVEVAVVATYGLDLVELGAAVRARVAAVLDDLVGPPAPGAGRPVDVTVVDVVLGDPRFD
jgi:hypothetical protein